MLERWAVFQEPGEVIVPFLDAPVSDRFGRASKFIIYDTESDSFEMVDDSVSLNAPQGAGIQTAQNIARHGVSWVITGHCGPKAFAVLKRANIRVFWFRAKPSGSLLMLSARDNLRKPGQPMWKGTGNGFSNSFWKRGGRVKPHLL